jgi:CubicO group peptidase (beta-lactamase class C family)
VTGAPSAVVGVSYHGDTIFKSSHGLYNINAELTPDADTIYNIGSITKAFTASAIGILVEEKKLTWTTPVHDILPELHSTSCFVTEELTVVDLLSHRTGLASSNEWWYGAGGELLLQKDQTIPFFNMFKSVRSLRTSYGYNNWNYAVLGEVIERLTGQPYGNYVKNKILEPLGLHRTSASHIFDSDTNRALPYAVLDDLSAYELPQPQSECGRIMAPAQAIRSSVGDLLKYAQALLNAYHSQLQDRNTSSSDSPLKNVVKQLTGHIGCGDPSMQEKSYCLGLHRHQLPNTLEGMGCNTMFVEKMPLLTPGNEARLLLSHGGSMAGYTTFISLLPEINCSIVVLVNSIGLGDPANWINQLIIEAMIDTPKPNDYLKLAKEAANNHILNLPRISERLEREREDVPPCTALVNYIGRYKDPSREFFVDVRLNDPNSGSMQLEILFQGLESQTWSLDHYSGDTFLLPMSFNAKAKRAIFTFFHEDELKFTFQSNNAGQIEKLYWAHTPDVPAEEQYFIKINKEMRNITGYPCFSFPNL